LVERMNLKKNEVDKWMVYKSVLFIHSRISIAPLRSTTSKRRSRLQHGKKEQF